MIEDNVIFSIPIYALNSDQLQKRVDAFISSLDSKYPPLKNMESSYKESVIETATVPYRFWKYNHIVGFIEISAKLNDIYFNLYLPHAELKKYYWHSEKKVLLENVGHDCKHFRVFDDESNTEIITKIREHLKDVVVNIPKNYYIDMEIFDLLTRYLNIKMLLKDVRERS